MNIHLAYRYTFTALFALSVAASCAKKPDDPGQCKLSCDQAIIASNDVAFAIRATATNLTLQCTTPGNFNRPIDATFLVSQDTGTPEAPRRTPVPFASVNPIVYGDLAPVGDPNPEANYQGILTPKSDWCSDSCGVVTMQLLPVCPPTGVSAQVVVALGSGPLQSDQNFVFVVESR